MMEGEGRKRALLYAMLSLGDHHLLTLRSNLGGLRFQHHEPTGVSFEACRADSDLPYPSGRCRRGHQRLLPLDRFRTGLSLYSCAGSAATVFPSARSSEPTSHRVA